MLVGGSLVAVHRQPLVHHPALDVTLLAQRLHHQLLQVAAQEQQAVLVRQHHHVLRAPPAAGVMPHERQQRGGVATQLRPSRGAVRRRRAGKEGVDVEAQQACRQQAYGRGHRGPAAHPVPQGEAGQPALLGGAAVQRAALTGHRHRVRRHVQAGGPIGGLHLQHAVARLHRAAGLGDHQRQRSGQAGPGGMERGQRALETLRVGVVQEEGLQRIVRAAQGISQ